MKKYIILGGIIYLTWYFLIREEPIKPVVVVPSKDSSAPNIVVSTDNTKDKLPPVYANPNDSIVASMIDTINQAYPNYTTAAEFLAARTKLFLNSQPQTTECLQQPCPTVYPVSDELRDKAKALIDLLDQYASQYKSIEVTGNGGKTADAFFS